MAKGELADRLKQETVAAMKSKDKVRLTTLRMITAAVKQIEVDTREELDEDGVVKVLRSYAKKVKDSLQGARDAGRDEMAAEAEAELALVQDFLPAEMDDAALEAVVGEVIAETGASSMKEMGQVMKACMARTGGSVDGSRVSAAVKKALSA